MKLWNVIDQVDAGVGTLSCFVLLLNKIVCKGQSWLTDRSICICFPGEERESLIDNCFYYMKQSFSTLA